MGTFPAPMIFVAIVGFVAMVAAVILLYLFIVCEDTSASNRAKGFSTFLKEINADLEIECPKSFIKTEDGEKLPCYKVSVSGVVRVPHKDFPCTFHVSLVDVTEPDNICPVLCILPEIADEDGFLRQQFDIDMPHEISSFKGLSVMVFPPEAMVFPRRGRRRISVRVAICPQGNPESRCFKYGSTTIFCNSKEYGYLEQEERSVKTNELIACIAITLCASDGNVDRRETAIVKSFFTEQFARLENPEKIKQAVNIAMKETLVAHKTGKLDIDAKITSLCKELVDGCRREEIHAAYELAVRIVAADDEVQDKEHASLRKLARQLEISADLAKEIQDKHFAVSMFSQASHESMLDMPTGLTREQKIRFLNRESQKWRSRVNHQNTKVRAEAEMRIQAVTKMRNELEKEPASA